jgi:hypothetical protein
MLPLSRRPGDRPQGRVSPLQGEDAGDVEAGERSVSTDAARARAARGIYGTSGGAQGPDRASVHGTGGNPRAGGGDPGTYKEEAP